MYIETPQETKTRKDKKEKRMKEIFKTDLQSIHDLKYNHYSVIT